MLYFDQYWYAIEVSQYMLSLPFLYSFKFMVNLRTNWLSEQERKHSHLVCGRTTSHKYFGVVFILDMKK